MRPFPACLDASCPRPAVAATIALLAVLGGCADPAQAPPRPAVTPARPVVAQTPGGTLAEPAWIEFGETPIVRAITAAGAGCPVATIDGRDRPMTLRAAAGAPAQRETANAPTGPGKPSVFPVDVCEAPFTPGSHEVRIAGRRLAATTAEPRRIVVLGDTGCRLKDATSQACSDPDGWPFAQVAAAAAAMKPDLVIHVGDYHYRETPCPGDRPGCAGSPWGYGWDAWNADFFAPAAPLLAAAPWVFVRGNHEACDRAGQGWFRLLAPEPWTARRSCDLAENDAEANFSAPYAVALGQTAQLIVFDSAHAGNVPLDLAKPGDAATYKTYVAQVRALDTLASPGVRSWFASHHPVLGLAPDDRPGALHPYPGNAPLQRALAAVNGTVYFPPAVQVALHGHVHLFQALGFDDGHPATLVAGNGGDTLDAPLPDPLPGGFQPAPGTHVAQATYGDAFGYLLLERAAGPDGDDGRWSVVAYRKDGREMTRCALGPTGTLTCAPHGWLH